MPRESQVYCSELSIENVSFVDPRSHWGFLLEIIVKVGTYSEHGELSYVDAAEPIRPMQVSHATKVSHLAKEVLSIHRH
jgi:hypothetical protein